MEFVKTVLAGVAGSVVFWFVDKQLLTLTWIYQIGGMVVVFVVCAAVFWLSRSGGAKGVRVLSGSKFDRGLTTKAERTTIETSGGADVLSGNKVGGPAKIDLKDTSIKT